MSKQNYQSQKTYMKRLRIKVMEFLGNKCASCGISDPDVLQIDHVRGGGTREKKRNGSQYHMYKHILHNQDNENYQILCANCNWKKRATNYEVRGRENTDAYQHLGENMGFEQNRCCPDWPNCTRHKLT